jgi:hypothetical protein
MQRYINNLLDCFLGREENNFKRERERERRINKRNYNGKNGNNGEKYSSLT